VIIKHTCSWPFWGHTDSYKKITCVFNTLFLAIKTSHQENSHSLKPLLMSAEEKISCINQSKKKYLKCLKRLPVTLLLNVILYNNMNTAGSGRMLWRQLIKTLHLMIGYRECIESCTNHVKVTHLLIKEVQLHHDLKAQSSHAQSCKTNQQNNLICTYCKLHLTR